MYEIELKFLVPADKLSYIKRQTHIKSSKTTHLAAHYFDTVDNILTKYGIALRIRKENDAWIQTIKTAGDGISKRLEINHELIDVDANNLQPDLSLYKNTPIETTLKKLNLTEIQNKLVCQYITDVTRTTRNIVSKSSVIEVAFDEGVVKNGMDDSITQPIQEVELELVEGDIDFLFETAQTWCKRYHLSLSNITKAHRGNLLLQNKRYDSATKSDLTSLLTNTKKKASQALFIRQVINNCLLQILPNASAIADGSKKGNHVHQLRVGIRRLRTALKYFSDFSDDINLEWLDDIKQTFTQLGEYRDYEILTLKTQPMLEELGSPPIQWDANIHVKVMPIEAVANSKFQLTLLQLIAFAASDAKQDSRQQPAKATIDQTLTKLFSKIAKASEHFASLQTEQQHNVRKRLKSLRYLSEFVQPFYKTKAVKEFVRYLEPAQDILGDFNDNCVAYEQYQLKSVKEEKALFALGWLTANEEKHINACNESLKLVQTAPVFW